MCGLWCWLSTASGVFGGHVWIVVLVVYGNEVFGGYVWEVGCPRNGQVLWTGGQGTGGRAGGGGAGCGAFFVVFCKMIIFE